MINILTASLYSQTDYWQLVTEIEGIYPTTMMATPSGEIFVATESGLFCSTDDGETWQNISEGLPKFNLAEVSNVKSLAYMGSQYIFAGTFHNGLYRSEDMGETWSNIGFNDISIGALASSQNGYLFVSTTWPDEFIRSEDYGDNWSKLVNYHDYPPVNIFIGPHNYIYAEFGLMMGDGEGYFNRSSNNGDSWEPIQWPRQFANCMAFKSDGTVYVGTTQPAIPPGPDYSGIYQSTDFGVSWIRLNPVIADNQTNATSGIALDSREHLYCGMEYHGVFYTVDEGNTWKEINSGLSDLHILSLAISKNDYVFAGTNGSGLFRSVKKTTHITVQLKSNAVYHLESPFPNPVNNQATIVFTILKPEYVKLNIFNLSGQEVMTITESYYPKGKHQIKFRTNQLSTGIYFIQLFTNDFISNQKFSILK